MCIIIYGKKEVELKQLTESYAVNPDGIGMMWAENGKLRFWKGFSFKKFYRYYLSLINRGIFPAIHFRLKTIGTVNIKNVHPFKVSRFFGMMHNGTFEIGSEFGKSDTAVFAKHLPLKWDQLDELEKHPFYQGVVNGSRILFMNKKGEVKIINKNATCAVEVGDTWYSKNNIFPTYVAVYGTLKKGMGNDVLLKYSKHLGDDIITGFDMYSNGMYPYLLESEGDNPIHVEVYKVSQYVMDNLDRLEGFPTHYQRKMVKTKYGSAWIYYYRDGHVGMNDLPVEDGNFSYKDKYSNYDESRYIKKHYPHYYSSAYSSAFD